MVQNTPSDETYSLAGTSRLHWLLSAPEASAAPCTKSPNAESRASKRSHPPPLKYVSHLFGHRNVEATEIYTNVLTFDGLDFH